jgi:hypothetical protein
MKTVSDLNKTEEEAGVAEPSQVLPVALSKQKKIVLEHIHELMSIKRK